MNNRIPSLLFALCATLFVQTAQGQAALGTGLLIAAKLIGTTLVARIFTLTRPALMTLPWFARLYGRWIAFETALLAPVKNSRLWKAGKEAARRVKAWWTLDAKPRWQRFRAAFVPFRPKNR